MIFNSYFSYILKTKKKNLFSSCVFVKKHHILCNIWECLEENDVDNVGVKVVVM